MLEDQHTKSAAVASLIALAGLSAGCASTQPRVGATPTFEMGGGFSMPQLPQAQFPGLTGSLAFILPRTSTWGSALVADVDASYLRLSTAAGPRVYARSGPLFSGRRTVTGFLQLLVGGVRGDVSGVLRSDGGFMVEPSAAIDYGAGSRALRVQVGYRNVTNGRVHDSRIPGEPIDRLSGTRVVVGMAWGLRPH